jgi:hypothetical protein
VLAAQVVGDLLSASADALRDDGVEGLSIQKVLHHGGVIGLNVCGDVGGNVRANARSWESYAK